MSPIYADLSDFPPTLSMTSTRDILLSDTANFLQAIGGWKLPVMLQRYGKVRNRALHEQMAKLNRLSEMPKIHETQ